MFLLIIIIIIIIIIINNIIIIISVVGVNQNPKLNNWSFHPKLPDYYRTYIIFYLHGIGLD